tara:strand:+ start:570 stop:1988 length:1419 start_codon:yes stop_codon:yes gene_type:complete
MALPVIKAKSYNYGSYSNPKQVRFRPGVGEQIGQQFGAGLAQGMQERRAEKKEQERLAALQQAQDAKDRLAAENKFIEENAQNYYEVYGKENSYSFSEFMKDNITYPDDTVDMKFNKKINRENLLNVGNAINTLENDGIDYTDPNILDALSKEDYQNAADKHKIKNGALIVRLDKSTNPPKAKFFLPDYSKAFKIDETKQPGEQFTGQPSEREIDIMSVFNYKATPKYNSNILSDKKYGLTNEDNLKKLPLEYVKQEIKLSGDGVNGRLYEVLDADRLFDDPNINFAPGVNAVVNDYGKSIWVDKMGNSIGSYTGSEEQKKLIREVVEKDVKNKISNFRLSSTKYTVPKDETTGKITSEEVNKIYELLRTKSGTNTLLKDLTYGPAGNKKAILDVDVPLRGRASDIGILKDFDVINLNLYQGRQADQVFEKSTPINLKNKDQFKKLLELTDAFGRGKENIDAIMAQYDNYIK